MPQIAAITLADGQATPVTHTFAPVGVDGGIAKYEDRVTGIALGFPTITLSIRRPAKGSRNFKIVRKIVLPVLEVTSPSTATGIQPAPTKAFEITNNSEWIIPERATPAQRADLLAYAKNFDASTVFQQMVKEYEAVW